MTDENKTDEEIAAEQAAAKNDGQTHDLREGDKPAVEEGINSTPAAKDKKAAAKSAPAANKSEAKTEGLKAKLARLAKVKITDVMGYSEERQTITTTAGGKYKLSEDGKSVYTLMGPDPNADTEA